MRMTSIRVFGSLILTLTAFGAAASEVQSDDPAEPLEVTHEEIVVTARKREESLQSTPVAVTVFGEEEVEARSMRDLSDVGDFTPNTTFDVSGGINGAPSEASVFIRGIGHLGTGIFEDPGVGIYVDGVYLARAQGSVLDLLDLERIEVLRGPQGTLFGKNTIGGAVQLITRKPHSEFLVDAELTVGEFDRLELREGVNGALGESVFGSFSSLIRRRDGYARSLASGLELDNDNRVVARGALRWLPSDRVIVDFAADFSRERIDGLDQPLVAISDDAPLVDFYNLVVGNAGFITYSRDFIPDSPYESYSSGPIFHDGDVWGGNLTVTWNLGAAALTSITAYRQVDFTALEDRDGTPIVFVETANDQQQHQLSQELQASGLAWGDRLTWLVGGLYFTESSDQLGRVRIFENLFESLEAAPGPIYAPPGLPGVLCDPGPPPPGLPCLGGAGNPFNGLFGTGFVEDVDHEVRSYAVFGQVSYGLSERLSLTAGLRYTYEEKELAIDQVQRLSGARTRLASADDWDAVSPKLGLELRTTPRTLVYGSVSWGFKSGGFNGITQNRDTLDSFGPEELIAYEVGLKSDWLDNRLRLNVAAFLNDYTDIQFSAALVEGTDIAFVIQNAGEGESKGVELELAAQPSRRFSLTGNVGYLDTEYSQLEGVSPDSVPLDGVFPKSPEWTVSLAPQLVFDLANGGDVTARVDYSFRSKLYHDVANAEDVAQDGYALVGARLAYAPPSDRWQLALFATNLTDEEYLEHGLFVTGFGPSLGIPGRPREWGASVRFRF